MVGVLLLAGAGPAGCGAAAEASAAYTKVLVIVEENETYDAIIGSGDAPYITELAHTYGQATALDAGYPAECPSLAAYVILTSGDQHGICDDDPPADHVLDGPSVFAQVAASGREWRLYGESMPRPCATSDSADGRFVVRHTPAAYYSGVRPDCRRWDVPLGTLDGGAFHDDLAAGLPALSYVIPDVCNDMHGGAACGGRDSRADVRAGDDWLRDALPRVMAGPDYAAGRLVVVLTWDEGTKRDNHIPTVVISPSTRRDKAGKPATLCSVLGLVSEVLAVEPLGCAADARRLAPAFHIDPTARS